MGVVIGNVKCLKYDKNDSKFYGKGAFVGDIVNVWLNNGTRFRGKFCRFQVGILLLMHQVSGVPAL